MIGGKMDRELARWNWTVIQLLSRRMIREENARRKSKPYWLADVLTGLRFIAAIGLFAMAYLGAGSVGLALMIFTLGELTDAFDGMAARKWLYPDDGRRRWWRVYASEIDQVADIALGVALISFVTLRINPRVGLTVLLLAMSIAVPIQLARDTIEQRWGKKVREAIVLVRRALYAAMIFVVAVWMLWLTSWSYSWKVTITCLTVVLMATLAVIKLDRMSEERTPLVRRSVPKFLESYC